MKKRSWLVTGGAGFIGSHVCEELVRCGESVRVIDNLFGGREANLAQHAFGADDNQLILFDDAGKHELPRASKLALARALVAHIARLLPKK